MHEPLSFLFPGEKKRFHEKGSFLREKATVPFFAAATAKCLKKKRHSAQTTGESNGKICSGIGRGGSFAGKSKWWCFFCSSSPGSPPGEERERELVLDHASMNYELDH